MVALVSLDNAKRHLRVDNNDSDEDITRKIGQASAIALTYIKRSIGTPDPEDDSIVDWTDETVPDDIAAAIELILSELYDDRIAGDATQTAGAYLPPAVLALLMPYRTPTLA
jgi:uncharacterized phage protein (predicted DNA packaging)